MNTVLDECCTRLECSGRPGRKARLAARTDGPDSPPNGPDGPPNGPDGPLNGPYGPPNGPDGPGGGSNVARGSSVLYLTRGG